MGWERRGIRDSGDHTSYLVYINGTEAAAAITTTLGLIAIMQTFILADVNIELKAQLWLSAASQCRERGSRLLALFSHQVESASHQ